MMIASMTLVGASVMSAKNPPPRLMYSSAVMPLARSFSTRFFTFVSSTNELMYLSISY